MSGPVTELSGYIPDFRFELYDLTRYSDGKRCFRHPATDQRTLVLIIDGEVEILIFPKGSAKPFSDQRDLLIRKTPGILSGRIVDPFIRQREI